MKIHQKRKEFQKQNENKSHTFLCGKGNVIISSPHGVNQVRLGKLKRAELGSIAVALHLQKLTNCHLIAKTKNCFDDANFDEHSSYKTDLEKFINENHIKFLIDIHGLNASRGCDINFGIHLGENISSNLMLFDNLNSAFQKQGFITWIDQPFMAGGNTISHSMKKAIPKLWTIQLEINYKLTNFAQNSEKLEKLVIILAEWIKEANKIS